MKLFRLLLQISPRYAMLVSALGVIRGAAATAAMVALDYFVRHEELRTLQNAAWYGALLFSTALLGIGSAVMMERLKNRFRTATRLRLARLVLQNPLSKTE